MSLVWKLLRQHISIGQFAGFFLANLFGMLIVMLGYQFYRDVVPVFTSEDSFMKQDFIIMSKRIGMGTTLSGRPNTFVNDEIDEVEEQPFIKKIGWFTRAEYQIEATMGVGGEPLLHTELFLESVPDGFVDVPLKEWKYAEGSREVPIILPRTYINMYNFGFAQSRKLPKISDGLAGTIDLSLQIHGHGQRDVFRGRVIGFSNRLNSILVPQAFMDWSNARYAPDDTSQPTRLIVEVGNPADERIAKFIERKGYEVENDKLQAEKTTYFLKLVVVIVVVIGLVISALSFYILMLSIYLLVQKNAAKLENLLLIGYSPVRVAMPYQWLTVVLNAIVLLLALALLAIVRQYYMNVVETLLPQLAESTLLPAVAVGLVLFLVVSVVNIIAIRRKVMVIWRR